MLIQTYGVTNMTIEKRLRNTQKSLRLSILQRNSFKIYELLLLNATEYTKVTISYDIAIWRFIWILL